MNTCKQLWLHLIDQLVNLCIHDFKQQNGGKDLSNCRRALLRLCRQCQSAVNQIHCEGKTSATIEIDSLFDGIDYECSFNVAAIIKRRDVLGINDAMIVQEWLRDLDNGGETFLSYFPHMIGEFDSLHQIAASWVPRPGRNLLQTVDRQLFVAMRAEKAGHRLLIAKGIKALNEPNFCMREKCLLYANAYSKRIYGSNKTKMNVKRDNFKVHLNVKRDNVKQAQSSFDRQVLLNSIISKINQRSVEDEKDDDAIKEE